MYIYIYLCIYIYICIYLYICIYNYMHIHTYRYIDISRLDTYRYTYMYIYVINPFSIFYFFLRIGLRKDLKNYNKVKFTEETI